jgi:hypothetical protein
MFEFLIVLALIFAAYLMFFKDKSDAGQSSNEKNPYQQCFIIENTEESLRQKKGGTSFGDSALLCHALRQA